VFKDIFCHRQLLDKEAATCRFLNRQALRALNLGAANIWVNIEISVREAMTGFSRAESPG
jgi:hypothetical protein